MIITPEDRRKVLEIFQDNPSGLSITEIARISGLNRNKSSLIASELCKKEILGLYQKGTYKIFSLKTPIAFHHLIDSIPDPVFVVNEEFSVVAINKAYIEIFQVDPEDMLGASGDVLLKPPYRSLSEDLKQECRSEAGGKKKIHSDKTGTPLCTTFAVPGTGQRSLLIIMLHPDERSRRKKQIQELIRKTETGFSTAILDILKEKTWSGALEKVAGTIHANLSDTLIFTLIIDEEAKTGSINSVHTPNTRPDTLRSGICRILNDTLIKQFPDIAIRRYKTEHPICYHSNDKNSLQDTRIPPEIQTIFRETGVSSLILMGISTGTFLTAIIGIGSFRDDIDPKRYADLLTSLSGYLTLTSTVYHTVDKKQENEREYQKRYGDVYSLLAEKSEEILHRTTEMEHIRSILGSVLQTLQISFIVTTPDGDLITANKTALETYNITEQDLVSRASVHGTLPPDLAGALMDLITKNRTGERRPDSVILAHNPKKIHWYLIRPKTGEDASCIFIGEEEPAPLIMHLISVQKDGVFIPGPGIFL